MLAGLGQDSLSGSGSITAVLLPGVSSPHGIVLTGGSPTLGWASGTGSSTPNGPVLLGPTGSGSGSSTGGSVQFVQTADTGSPNAGTDPPNRPTWDDVKDWYPGPRWQFELESELGLYDSSDEESKPKDQGTGESDASQSDEKSRARSWWGILGWFLGDNPAQGSLWKSGPSDVLRPGDIGTYNNGKSQAESLEDAGKATKELIDGAGRDAALAAVGGAIGRSLGAQNASKPPIWTSTKDRTGIQNALYHFQKHSGEFPEYPNAMQYAKGARDFVTAPPAGTLTKLRPSGDVLFYNPSTNTFAVRNADGSLRTMFRPPNGINYWNQQ